MKPQADKRPKCGLCKRRMKREKIVNQDDRTGDKHIVWYCPRHPTQCELD